MTGDEPAEANDRRHEQDQVRDAGNLAAGQGEKRAIPSSDERDAPGDHECETIGDGRRAERGDQGGHLEAGHQDAVEQAAGDADRQSRHDGE